MEVRNTDHYHDLASVKAACWSCLKDELSSRHFEPRAEDEELQHYTEHNGDLYGCAFDYEPFCCSSSDRSSTPAR